MALPAEEPATTAVTADMFRAEFAEFRAEMRAEMAEFRAEMWRAFWIFGTGIVAAGGAITTVANVLS